MSNQANVAEEAYALANKIQEVLRGSRSDTVYIAIGVILGAGLAQGSSDKYPRIRPLLKLLERMATLEFNRIRAGHKPTGEVPQQ